MHKASSGLPRFARQCPPLQEVMDNQITSLKQQNDSESWTLLVPSLRHGCAIATLSYPSSPPVAALDGQKSDLEEQLFAALQHRHQFASTVSAPVFPLSHK